MGDALLKGYTANFTVQRKMNHGELPKCCVKTANPPIVSREIYQAVQTTKSREKMKHK